MILGCHCRMKAPDYLEGSVKEALGYNADALMVYTGAPQNTVRKETGDLHVEQARQMMHEAHLPMQNMIIHAPYIINPANSVNPRTEELAVSFLQKEVLRTDAIGAKYIVLHPGSAVQTDTETGIQTAIRHLNEVNVPENIVICLETMAGKGSEIGFRFEQLGEILSGLREKDRYGVCLDTCHIHDAGYDLSDFDAVLDHFDHVVGLNRLHVIHFNDSKNERGSHKDRHANIGKGKIGMDVLRNIALNDRIQNIPMILETPYIDDKPPYKEEIEMIRKWKSSRSPT